MVIATEISLMNKSQEQMTDIIADDAIENASINANPLSSLKKTKVEFISPNSNNHNGITTVSVGVGQDTDSDENQTKHVTNTDEYKYAGDVYADKKHGKGILSWSDGRMYTGAFFADKRHGFGIYHTPDISEFKGLYCQDERFGPGILMYKPLESADVGLWLSETLVRLLYPHPNLRLDIQITDKKPPESSSGLIPSWYSPQEMLRNASALNFISQKKSSNLFCHDVRSGNSSLLQYLRDHLDRLQESMSEKRAQLDAYLSSIDGKSVKEAISKERKVDVPSPNETYEQQQLFDYINQFWPLKQRALFPIDDIISNTRSSFPRAGPLENGSLNLFELSFHGRGKEVRDLLMQRFVYVDVCDSQGLTALHFATYNAHLDVLNTLLDFGGNVDQLSDDGLTPLALAFLLYYGNNPYQTINTALEHSDPIVLNPRTPVFTEASRSTMPKQNLFNSSSYFTSDSSINDEVRLPSSLGSIKINDFHLQSSYGYQLTDDLRERLRDEEFRQSIHAVILVLLRRGADPSYSIWPLPVLALAVRAGDIPMVQLLLQKKTEVNCQLNASRHASLTPLHIACGCSASSAIDIARQLLEHGANVNAQSRAGNKEYFSLLDPLVIDTNKITENQQRGRTPLHVACTRDRSSDTLDLVRLLLEYQADPNAVCNGQTPLTLAIVLGNEPLVDLLLNHKDTDPSTPLGLGNGNALCTVLSIFYEPQWTYAKRLELIERLMAKSPKVLYPIRFGPKNTLGSSVDFAHYMFSSDTRISQSPYHSLTSEERARFTQRKELLAYIAKRFREEVSKYEDILRLPTPAMDFSGRTPSPADFLSRNSTFTKEKSSDPLKMLGEFRYCATCGRSSGVRLTLCKRCQKASFCSKTCRVDGWNQFHRYQCRHLSSPIPTAKNCSSRIKSPTNFDRILTLKTPPKPTNPNRLPPLPVSKLLRQKRIRNRQKSAANAATTLDGIVLSWNSTYNAPENYSFN